jgi:CPA2 family monovalent cation:H+ antiporter-2
MTWTVLLDILILLGAALLLGTIAEQLRQSAMLGYLVAGTLVGPNVLGFVRPGEHVSGIADLGVALLLFTIGLEFSFRRLRRLGRTALLGGSLQIGLTMLATGGVAAAFGLDGRAAIALGAMVALSSTACVLRLFADRGEVDSLHGRSALGILLFQDLAVIPLMLLMTMLGGEHTPAEGAIILGRTLLAAVALAGGFWLLSNFVAPRALNIERWAANRELPILLACVLALGSAYAAQAAGLSAATGAFVAGVLLGESPFATQIRADVAALRTLLVTLFFASIGLIGDPAWAIGHWHLVGAVVLLIVAGKALVVWPVLRAIGQPSGIALATGLCLAQVGEFSFVLAGMARPPASIISEDVFRLIVSATIATLFLTPLLVAAAPRVADLVDARGRRRRGERAPPAPAEDREAARRPIVVVGFGPAGQAVAHALLRRHREEITVIELNARTAAAAERLGLRFLLGDAAHRDVLEHAGIARARVVAITVPDPGVARTIIHQCRRLAPQAAIIARSRYHVRRWELELAGARETLDEEETVGLRMAAAARRHLAGESRTPDAS